MKLYFRFLKKLYANSSLLSSMQIVLKNSK